MLWGEELQTGVVREGFSEEVTFKLMSQPGEEQRKSGLGGGNSSCKGFEVGSSLAPSSNQEEAKVASGM